MYICIWKIFSLKKWEHTGSFLIPLGHVLDLNSFIHPVGNPSTELFCAETYIVFRNWKFISHEYMHTWTYIFIHLYKLYLEVSCTYCRGNCLRSVLVHVRFPFSRCAPLVHLRSLILRHFQIRGGFFYVILKHGNKCNEIYMLPYKNIVRLI